MVRLKRNVLCVCVGGGGGDNIIGDGLIEEECKLMGWRWEMSKVSSS